jgi:hypothetical protein
MTFIVTADVNGEYRNKTRINMSDSYANVRNISYASNRVIYINLKCK